jgi:hypothetical protein
MQFSVLNAQAKIEMTVEASSLEEACRKFSAGMWHDDVAETKVIEAPRYVLSSGAAVLLDPYIVVAAGMEREAWAKHQEQFETDVHFAPDPSLDKEPRLVDTGGPNPGGDI